MVEVLRVKDIPGVSRQVITIDRISWVGVDVGGYRLVLDQWK